MNIQEKEETTDNILVVCEYEDVFLKSYQSCPSKRDCFEIELIPGSQPISKASYHMAPTELIELKIQSEELEHKEFIRLHVSR